MKQVIIDNVNDIVKVKLNDLGRKIDREYHLNLLKGTRTAYVPREEDNLGYTDYIFHELLSVFGDSCYLGADSFFDEIVFPLENKTNHKPVEVKLNLTETECVQQLLKDFAELIEACVADCEFKAVDLAYKFQEKYSKPTNSTSDKVEDWVSGLALQDNGKVFMKDTDEGDVARVTYGDLRRLLKIIE